MSKNIDRLTDTLDRVWCENQRMAIIKELETHEILNVSIMAIIVPDGEEDGCIKHRATGRKVITIVI